MANLFSQKPDLPPLVLPKSWMCPITGLTVPKEPAQNLAYRLRLLEAAEQDIALQTDLYTACSQSILYFINTFVFTLRIFETGESGTTQQAVHQDLPFVTWPKQDEHILKIEDAIDGGTSLLTDKSRDMGATWDHLAVYLHRFLFRKETSGHLMISRKEDAVDNLDGSPRNYPYGMLADPGTLFGKLDYMLSRLPEWMVPRIARKKMHLVNLDNPNRIDGESSNATAGSSDRRVSAFLDEMAKMAEAESIKRSLKSVTACMLACSTPNGAGTAFSKWRLGGQVPVFVLPWWEHPEKGLGRTVEKDKLGRFVITSPWYKQRQQEMTLKEIAIELDMDHIGSGETFFEAVVIEQMKRIFGRPPRREAELTFKKKLSDEAVIEAVGKVDIGTLSFHCGGGPWKIWTRLTKGRPDQAYSYLIAIDISKGQGASNSVMNITCNETREKIAEFADANTPPYELARLACAAAIWCGGRNRRPLIIWENNGDPGFDFGRQLVHIYKYPSIYFTRQAGTLSEKVGKRYGWRSSTEGKAAALGLLRRAYSHGKYLNHSIASLDEALTYINYDGGGIGPAELIEESDSARKAHGDRVIADMLAVTALAEMPKWRDMRDTPKDIRAFGYRLEQYRKQRKLVEDGKKRRTHFDFTAAA